MPARIAVHLTAEAERHIRAGHPWLYNEGIAKQSRAGESGELAALYDRRNRFLAIGLYDPASPLRVRILQAVKPAAIDQAWFERRLADAAALRRGLPAQGTTGYRVVHGENDGLPGLVIDRYHSTLVMKLYTAAWMPHLPAVRAAIAAVLPARRVILRLARAVAGERGDGTLSDGRMLSGPPPDGPVEFEENGLRFEADPLHGQKTGYFFDQRENRARLQLLCRGRSVLDAFAYTGGFSVHAARGGASDVLSVDASRPALAAAQRNMLLNRRMRAVASCAHAVKAGDVFEILPQLAAQKRRFGAVVLDPPSLAKSRTEVPRAIAVYRRLARLGLSVLAKEGVFMFSSCSSHVTRDQFFTTVLQAAGSSGRRLTELARTGHPIDHPVRFKEGAYLKAIFAIG